MSIIAENYLEIAKNRRKLFEAEYPTSSKPKDLFVPIRKSVKDPENYVFSSDNWNGFDLLRDYIYEKMEATDKDFVEIKTDRITVFIYFCIDEDDRRATIIVKEDYVYNSYFISWYKHRGKTDNITKNGQPISLLSYIELLNILGISL